MSTNDRYIREVTWRPERPDGVKYDFNCCAMPDVWETENSAECRNCGHDWTEAEP